MDCKEYRKTHPGGSEEARAHLERCADCRAFAGTWDLLKEYPGIEPSPGFIAGVRRRLSPARLRLLASAAALAAALLVAVVLFESPRETAKPPVATEEELELAENLDLLEDYDLIDTLELVSETRSPLFEEKN